jgi:hypothetical protein
LHFTAAELRRADSISIADRTARRELFRFRRDSFEPKIRGVEDSTRVVFGKNLTFRQPERFGHRQIMVTLFNERDRPIRSSAFNIKVEPHPSETLTAETSFELFSDIAQIDHRDACRPRRERFGIKAEILIGEEEQTFPSLAHLSQIQVRKSLEGYFEGCKSAYVQCLGGRVGAGEQQRIEQFCAEERRKLRQEVFAGGRVPAGD